MKTLPMLTAIVLLAAGSSLGGNISGDNISAWNALTNCYQSWRSIVPDSGGTCTITYAHGGLIYIAPGTNITVRFDNSTYTAYTNGVLRVRGEIFAPTNSLSFEDATITNASAVRSTNDYTRFLWDREGTNQKWKGKQ